MLVCRFAVGSLVVCCSKLADSWDATNRCQSQLGYVKATSCGRLDIKGHSTATNHRGLSLGQSEIVLHIVSQSINRTDVFPPCAFSTTVDEPLHVAVSIPSLSLAYDPKPTLNPQVRSLKRCESHLLYAALSLPPPAVRLLLLIVGGNPTIRSPNASCIRPFCLGYACQTSYMKTLCPSFTPSSKATFNFNSTLCRLNNQTCLCLFYLI
jgi:hypothetical protein